MPRQRYTVIFKSNESLNLPNFTEYSAVLLIYTLAHLQIEKNEKKNTNE